MCYISILGLAILQTKTLNIGSSTRPKRDWNAQLLEVSVIVDVV